MPSDARAVDLASAVPEKRMRKRRLALLRLKCSSISIVSNENGEPTGVIVPIELWREIESERETAHLLRSETMRNRLLAAKERQDGIPVAAR